MTRLAFLALAWACLHAQAAEPTFEVASIRPSQSGSRGMEVTPGNLIIRNTNLREIIAFAYGVQDIQVVGPA